ncbi:acyl carrier protein [Duodenibacillus massiliensis]|uniref:acyl carrier protein n=1 Tax=Duodenibacillus massiliensis TaxID=1852381 RepID=UPI003F8213A0
MVTEQQVFDELKKILVETFEVKPEEVTKDAKIYDDLDIDSIDAVDLMVKLQPFIGNRRISPADFKSVRTIGDLTETLVKLINDPQA